MIPIEDIEWAISRLPPLEMITEDVIEIPIPLPFINYSSGVDSLNKIEDKILIFKKNGEFWSLYDHKGY